jgi:major vault protein
METNRERDLVLAPNEYAFISDQTKGHIVTYVGPFKTSMANTDKPVIFDSETKRFRICSLEESIQTFMAAPEGWYVELKNPPQTGAQPKNGTSNSLTELEIGRKVNIPGPVFFALWPGQMARVTPGHRLRSNQYLMVRVYDDEQARKHWTKAVVKHQKNTSTPADASVATSSEAPELTLGQIFVIKGTEVSFYIPPTGVEVVRDENGNYVRDAVTLERMEYCILLDENGNKRYIKGPDVVFPEPTEGFIVKNGQVKFKAIELSEISGIYVKVIAPYDENKKKYEVGEELFITGKEMIYFPRPEHALIKYGDREVYHAVAIPAGEGRYFLNRKTGQVSLKKGPIMFLPDPREAVIVRRILSTRQVELWFPGNKEAMEYNKRLQEVAEKERSQGKQEFFIEEQKVQMAKKLPASASGELKSGVMGDEISRSQSFAPPRTITLDSKYEGAVTLDIWTGYAVMVTSKTGERKVIVGPQTYLLEYDENMQLIELSTGTPKTDTNLLRTVYLRVLHNKVSDIVEAETKDSCNVKISLSYRVNFTGEPIKWFNVENYVKFLTDHLRSVIRNALQKYSVMEFHANGIALIRDMILGKPTENTKRPGRLFEENGMVIYDVEVLDIQLLDQDIQTLISKSQHDEVRNKLTLQAKLMEFEYTQKTEDYARQIAEEKSKTLQDTFRLRIEEYAKQFAFNMTDLENKHKTQQKQLQIDLNSQEMKKQINDITLLQKKAEQELQLQMAEKMLAQKLQELNADVQAVVSKAEAVSPDLIAALQAFSDRALAEKMAETMAPLSILGGKSIAEVFSNMLRGTVLENVLQLKANQMGEEGQ